MQNVHNITPLGFVRAAFLFKASQLAALFCCQSAGAPASRYLPGRYPYTCRAVQSLMDAPRGSHKVLYNRCFPLKPSKSLYNRFCAALVSLYYSTPKRRLEPHRRPHSMCTKITRLAIRQDGHYYTCQRRAIESTAHHSRRSSYHAQCCREHSTPRNGQSLKVE